MYNNKNNFLEFRLKRESVFNDKNTLSEIWTEMEFLLNCLLSQAQDDYQASYIESSFSVLENQ